MSADDTFACLNCNQQKPTEGFDEIWACGDCCTLLSDATNWKERAERAESERDEARALAVHAWENREGTWTVQAPGGHLLCAEGWVSPADVPGLPLPRAFATEAEALAAGRAVPWWEVKP